MEDGWIEWAGGECPVGRDTLVQAQLRCDYRSEGEQADPEPAGGFRWNALLGPEHDGAGDIIAYRVVPS